MTPRFLLRHAFQLNDREKSPHEKLPEVSVLRADFIETHISDEFLEIDWIFREQRDSPFPRVESDCACDHLLNATGVTTTSHSVVVHEPASLLER